MPGGRAARPCPHPSRGHCHKRDILEGQVQRARTVLRAEEGAALRKFCICRRCPELRHFHESATHGDGDISAAVKLQQNREHALHECALGCFEVDIFPVALREHQVSKADTPAVD